MTTPVEELRSAAVLLRQRAEDATPGPWRHTGTGPGQEYMGCGTVYTVAEDLYGGEIAAPAGDLYARGGYSPAGDMAYIATIDPLVGLALADLLDRFAAMSESGAAAAASVGVDPAQIQWPVEPAGLAVARLILGGTS